MSEWRRTDEAVAVDDAIRAIDSGAAWAVLWCGGEVSRSTDSPVDDEAVSYARAHVIEPARRKRLQETARRKGRTKTVVMAERWQNDRDHPMIVFYEAGPHLLPERDDPFRW